MTIDSAHQARRFRSASGLIALLVAVLAAPIAWMRGPNPADALVLVASAGGSTLPLHLVSSATLLLAMGGGWVAWREWGRAGREVPGESEATIPRSRFMAAIGVFGSAF